MIKKNVDIEIMDAILSRTNKDNLSFIEPVLSYKAVYWKKGQYRKEKQEYMKKIFKTKGKSIYFFSGFVPRVKDYIKSTGTKVKVFEEKIPIFYDLKRMDELINLDTKKRIELRDYQKNLIRIAFKEKRGIIKAATGIGKSYVILGMINCFDPSEKVLVLCHTTSIVKQLYDEFKQYIRSITMLGGDADPDEKKKPFSTRLVVSTIQSFSRINPESYCDYFSCVFIDESHRVSSFEGEYAHVLSNLLAPIRIGTTATPPITPQAVFAYEGLIGPIIGEMTINEAAEKDILAKPRIKLIKAGFPPGIRDLRDYHTVYYEGIVKNKTRNSQIISIIQEIICRKETVLVFVNKIEHGNNILSIADEQGLEVVFVQGSSTLEIRERIKYELETGVTKAVIATSVWKEGVNIVNLNNVINAGGGKSEIQTLQQVGRGLRKTAEKTVVIIYDFFDSAHPYLISHSGDRICLYMDNKWL